MAGVDPPLYKDWLQSKDLKFHWANKNETYVQSASYDIYTSSNVRDGDEVPLWENNTSISKNLDGVGPHWQTLRTSSSVAPLSKFTGGCLFRWTNYDFVNGDYYVNFTQNGFTPGGWGVTFRNFGYVNYMCDWPNVNINVLGSGQVPYMEWTWLVFSFDFGGEGKVYKNGDLIKTIDLSSCTPSVSNAVIQLLDSGSGGGPINATNFEYDVANLFVVEEIIPEWEIKMMWDRVVNPERQYLSAAVREAVTDSDSLLYLPLQDMPTMSSRSIRAYYNGVDVEDRNLVKSGSPAMSGWTPAGTSIGPGPTDVSAFTDG